jgi:hypothetical protein
MIDGKKLAREIVDLYEAGYSTETLANIIDNAASEEKTLLKACSYFLNMLPNERHPNNEFGYRESYDLAAALDRYHRKVPA